jgi:hypothetical protein
MSTVGRERAALASEDLAGGRAAFVQVRRLPRLAGLHFIHKETGKLLGEKLLGED